MKILQIIDVYKTGGAEKVFNAFIKYCGIKNINLDSYTFYRSEVKSFNFLFEKNAGGIIKKGWQQFLGIRRLVNIIKNDSYTRIVSYLDRSNILCVIAARKCHIPVTVTVHNPPTIQYEKLSKFKPIVLWLLRFFYNKKHVKVIAVSEQVSNSLKSIGVNKIHISYNPLIHEEVNANIKIPFNNYYISIGRLEYQKAYWKLIKAVKILKEKYNTEIDLIILGEGRDRNELEVLISELGLTNRIKLLGFVQNPLDYVAKAKAMIFSSYYEGFPITLLECYSLKKAAIGTQISIPNEIRMNFSENNFFYNNICEKVNFNSNETEVDDEKLAEIIYFSNNNIGKLDEMAEIGYNWVSEHCSLESFDNYL